MGEDLRHPFGDVAHLIDQLEQFCRQIEGDLWLKGDDLRDLLRPNGGASRLTWRRLSMILDALPGDSLYKTAVRDSIDEHALADLAKKPRVGFGRWSHTDLLLADIIDRLGVLCYAMRAYEQVPAPYRRPGVTSGRRKADPQTMATIKAIAEEHARLHGYDLD